jgi:RHS repeat-associated protein
MTYRAPSYLTTCAGTPTGQQLTYDAQGRLVSWQNAPSSPTTTVSYAYDGEGQRIGQKVVSGGATTRTYYLAGGLEEITGTTVTKYYAVPGIVTALNVGGTVSYLASDGLGSVSVALAGGSASVTASLLYGPYGTYRYSSGTMPTARGFTGQYADASTGLDYYGARYYDPAVGQFAQADTDAKGGLNRYAYVGGNPETKTDPSGHRLCDDCDGGSGSSGQTSSPFNIYRWLLHNEGDFLAGQGIVVGFEQERIARAIAALNKKTVFVQGYTRADGTVVDSYWRRAPGSLGKIAFLERYGWVVDGVALLLAAAGFAADWYNTSTSYYAARPQDGVAQAVGIGALHATFTTAFAFTGAAIGQALIPIPFVGAAVGAFGGALVGNWLGDQIVQANELPNNSYTGDPNYLPDVPMSGL